MAIEIRAIAAAPPGELETLFREAGFWPADAPDAPEYLARVIAGSAVFAAAFDDGRIVGMARALSDRVSDAFIQDVAVHASYRKRGIGGELVRFVIGELRAMGVDWIGLVGVPGTRDFYRSLGFEELAGHAAFKLSEPR